MADILERLSFDAARCEATFSKGVAQNIEEAAAEIVRLRAVTVETRELLERIATSFPGYIPDFVEPITRLIRQIDVPGIKS